MSGEFCKGKPVAPATCVSILLAVKKVDFLPNGRHLSKSVHYKYVQYVCTAA